MVGEGSKGSGLARLLAICPPQVYGGRAISRERRKIARFVRFRSFDFTNGPMREPKAP